MPQSCGLASLVHNMRGLPSNLFSFALKCTISIIHIQCLVMDLGHFTIVGRILFAPFRLYSDKVLQATCSCTSGHVDSSFFATLNFFEALPTLPTLPPSSFIYCRPWRWQLQQWFRDSGIIYARNTNNQWSLMLAKLFESWQQWFRII